MDAKTTLTNVALVLADLGARLGYAI